MRGLSLATALLVAFGVLVATAQQNPAPVVRGDLARAFGELPKRGNLADVLSCAGANEVFWTSAMKENP
jgi:hypothetical protein